LVCEIRLCSVVTEMDGCFCTKYVSVAYAKPLADLSGWPLISHPGALLMVLQILQAAGERHCITTPTVDCQKRACDKHDDQRRKELLPKWVCSM
jgi:hypothetical protein